MKNTLFSRLAVVALFAALMFTTGLWAADCLKLTDDGRVTAEVVVADDAPRPLKFAKAELEKYLAILATNACRRGILSASTGETVRC